MLMPAIWAILSYWIVICCLNQKEYKDGTNVFSSIKFTIIKITVMEIYALHITVGLFCEYKGKDYHEKEREMWI